MLAVAPLPPLFRQLDGARTLYMMRIGEKKKHAESGEGEEVRLRHMVGNLLIVYTYYTPRTVNGVTGISGSMFKGGCLFSLRGARRDLVLDSSHPFSSTRDMGGDECQRQGQCGGPAADGTGKAAPSHGALRALTV